MTSLNDTKDDRVSFGRFLRDVGVVFAIGSVLVLSYYVYVTEHRKFETLLKDIDKTIISGDLPSLEKAQTTAIEYDASNPQLAVRLAKIFALQVLLHGEDKLNDAVEYLELAEQNTNSPELLTTQLYVKLAKKEYLDVKNAAFPLVESKDPEFCHIYGWALSELGESQKATPYLKSASNVEQQNSIYLYNYAQNAHQRGRLKHALRLLTKLQIANPQFELASQYQKALLSSQITITKTKVAPSNSHLSADTQSPFAQAYFLWHYSIKLMEEGQIDASLSAIQQALTFRPGYAPFMVQKAAIQQLLNQNKLAAKSREESVQRPYYWSSVYEVALIVAKTNPAQATRYLQTLEAIEPNKKEYNLLKAEIAYASDKPEAALRHFKKAAVSTSNPHAYFMLAKLRFARQRKKKSADMSSVVEAINSAINLQNTYPKAYELLGRVALVKRKPSEAQRAFRRAEKQLRKQKTPNEQIRSFYSRIVSSWKKTKIRKSKQYIKSWKQKLAKVSTSEP